MSTGSWFGALHLWHTETAVAELGISSINECSFTFLNNIGNYTIIANYPEFCQDFERQLFFTRKAAMKESMLDVIG